MIEVTGLSKSFGPIKAVNDVSIAIPGGVITGLVGPNGCGKTTLIKSLLGLVIPDSGTIRVQGEVIENSFKYRSKIGYMPQNPEFPENLSIGELLTMLEDLRDQRAIRRTELSDLLGVGKLLDRRFGELSGGTKQRVAAVAALMFDSPILILDEPTVGLDPVSAARFKHLILRDAQRSKAVLLVTHIMSEMEQMAQNMIFMLEGQVRFHGSLSALRSNGGRDLDLESAIVNLSGES